ncbi:unnamed protein product [Absidia cylindrospora]
MPSLPIVEQTPSSSSSSIQPPPPTLTRKRKRRNSTMVIKPARWSPPLHHHQHPSSTFMTATPIETDFQPTFYNPNEIKHRRRISSQQYGILEDEYQINTKPNASKRHYLAELLGMTPRTVQIWFQNKRAKAKHHQDKPLHAETKSPVVSTIKSLAVATKPAQSSAPRSSSANATTTPGPVDQFVFDDGRLDPIYLMDDYDMATFMAAASSPSLSSTSTSSMVQYGTDQQQSSSDHHDSYRTENDNVTGVVERMDGNYGQQPCTMDDHGTSTATAAPTILSTSSSPSSVSSSPLLPSSGTYDSFAMGLHYSTNTNQHQHQHQCYDETPLSASIDLSSPCQPFSPLNSSSLAQYHDHQQKNHNDPAMAIPSSSSSSSSADLYSMMKETDNDQTLELRHDSLYILNWIQKTPPSNLPQLGASVVPTWPYVMDQSDLQTDGFDFSFDHDDWMGPFYVSA